MANDIRKLLIVEDDAAFARALARSFERRGYEVRAVAALDPDGGIPGGFAPTHAVVDLKLAGGAILLAGFAGIALGTLAAYRMGRPSDRAISSVGIVGMSVPQYWVGMVLIVLFAVQLGWLPATGMGDPTKDSIGKLLSHILLPMITLATVPAGILSRSVRSTVSEVSSLAS